LHLLTPATKLVGALGFLSLIFLFPWPWTAGIVLAVLSLLAAVSSLWRKFAGIVFRAALPYVLMLLVMQSLFFPGGATPLLRLAWFTVKLEGVMYATVTALRILAMVAVFVLVQMVTHPAAMMADLEQRGLSSKVTYVVVSTLNILPFLMGRAGAILDAQRSRGLETEGSILRRGRALLSLIGPLVVGTINDVQDRAVALELRGFSRTGTRTFLTDTSGPPCDRALRLVMWGLAAVGLLGRVVAWVWPG